MKKQIDKRIDEQIKKIKQIYQPVFGRDNLNEYARESEDRLSEILSAYNTLRDFYGRDLKVLDLGCAQGYFSFHLAQNGAKVIGVELDENNYKLCCLIKEQFNFSNLEFINESVECFLDSNTQEKFDFVLVLNILHHVCYINNKEIALDYFQKISNQSNVVLYEAALFEEPVFWANKLPKKVEYFTNIFKYSFKLSDYPTHLSDVKRPLIFCSNNFWYMPTIGIYQINHMKTDSHDNSNNFYQNTRKYFFNDKYIFKYYDLSNPKFYDANLNELRNEYDFLTNNTLPASLSLPTCLSFGTNDSKVWLQRELVSGVDLGSSQINFDNIESLLYFLVELEKEGYYHNDLKKWNLLKCEEKLICLDYGSISKNKYNLGAPSDIYISFLLLLRELESNTIERNQNSYNPLISPMHFSNKFKVFISKIWDKEYTNWSFKLFYDLYFESKNTEYIGDKTIWNGIIESCIADLNNKFKIVEQIGIKTEQTGVKLIETESLLDQTGAKLIETESLLEQTGVKLIETESLLEQTGVKLIETESLLEQTGVKLIETESLLEQTGVKLIETEQKLSDMESSFIWKIIKPLRVIVSITKRILGK